MGGSALPSSIILVVGILLVSFFFLRVSQRVVQNQRILLQRGSRLELTVDSQSREIQNKLQVPSAASGSSPASGAMLPHMMSAVEFPVAHQRFGTATAEDSRAPEGLLPSLREVEGRRTRDNRPVLRTSNHSITFFAEHSEDEFVRLEESGTHYSLPLENPIDVKVNVRLSVAAGEAESKKAALFSVRTFDENDEPINTDVLRARSPRYGSFIYLEGSSSGASTSEVTLTVPRNARRLEIGVVPWERTVEISNTAALTMTSLDGDWLRNRRIEAVRVAMVLDEFSYNSFRFDCVPIVVEPTSWRETFERELPDLFLCESAWSGVDSEKRPWKGKVYASENFDEENRSEILDILEYCRNKGIPTVFWNKEDPSHYPDKTHNFVDTAVRFDHVFTSAIECVERYKEDHGHTSVHALPFAVQPRLFNPIEHWQRSTDIVFAGGWYENHVDRSEQMRVMFDRALESGRGLKIYDRFYGTGDPAHVFPTEYQRYLNPPVPHAAVAEVYKESDIGMTINTETESETMFARRIFELMACNTYVVSNYSAGVEKFFGNNVAFLDRDAATLTALTPEAMERAKAENLELVLSEHTYRARLEYIYEIAGIEYENSAGTSLVVEIRHADEAVRAVDYLHSQASQFGRLVLLAKSSIDPLHVAELFAEHHSSEINVLAEKLLLDGKTDMRQAFDATEGAVFCASPDVDLAPETVKRFQSHSSYVDCPIVAADTGERYGFGMFCGQPVVYFRDPQDSEYLASYLHAKPFSVYEV